MTLFESKTAPTSDKLRGGYYTPMPIAEFTASWVAQAGSRLLEPSCGDGSILEPLTRLSSTVQGVELFADEAAIAIARTGADVEIGDFFSWFAPHRQGQYDGVAGNPPYIRFGNWTEPERSIALDLMRSAGMRPSKLTNAWVPFVVASVLACRAGGRIGLVLPAELMQVGYAAQLRQFLIDQCEEINVVAFKRLVFPGILQEVILLLATVGEGPARMQVVEVDDAASLAGLKIGTAEVRAPLHEREKWTKYHLSPVQIEKIRALRQDERLSPMEHFASVDVGVVTGRNSFFVMSSAEAEQNGVSDLTIPLVSRSAQLDGTIYTKRDHTTSTHRTELLDARGVSIHEHQGLRQYVHLGEVEGVHEGYKCRIRKDWWVVPSIWPADAFMLRQIHTHPRVIANSTLATSTDTVHRMRVAEGIDSNKLATAFFNSVTFALSEIVGRSYGGGILELEPSEAEELRVPDPALVSDELTEQVDLLVRSKKIDEALDLVDQTLLVDGLGFTADEVTLARSVWTTLKDRRNNRAKKKLD